MIKVKGIETVDFEWNYSTPPRFYKKISKNPDEAGFFVAEVFKLKSFNNFTQEAIYAKVKNEKLKSTNLQEQFNLEIPKKTTFQMED